MRGHGPGAALRMATLLLAAAPGAALGQFNMVPPPQCPPSAAAAVDSEAAYRREAARHIYECFPGRVYLGVLPPLIYGVMTVEAEIDEQGRIAAMHVVRKPAADEVEPWLLALMRRAVPFPLPSKMPGGTARFIETFFVDRSGLFQTQSLSEGQKGMPPAEGASPLTSSTTPP